MTDVSTQHSGSLKTVPNSVTPVPEPQVTDLITPAPVVSDPNKKLLAHVDRFVSELNLENELDTVKNLSFDQLLAQFKRGYSIQDVIDHSNAFAKTTLPSEDLVDELTSYAIDATDRIEEYESVSAAILPDSKLALSNFCAEILAKCTGDPAQDVSFQKEAGAIAEQIASDFFTRARGDFKLDIAELSPAQIEQRTAEVAHKATEWFKAELEVQLNFQAARGIPESKLKAEVTYDDFVCMHEKALARSDHFQKIEKMDDEQDELLSAKMRPALTLLADQIKEYGDRVKTDIPEPWLGRIGRFATSLEKSS